MPVLARHYLLPTAIRPEGLRPGGRRQVQARDVFDLSFSRAGGEDLRGYADLRPRVPAAVRARLGALLPDYRGQVIASSSPSTRTPPGSPEAWDAIGSCRS